MNVRTSLLGACLLAACVVPTFSEIMQQADAAGQAPATPGTQSTTLPAQSQQPQGSAPLRVMVGKSLLINTTERLRRISVTDPNIAFAQVITPTQILVHGKTPGEVSLLIFASMWTSAPALKKSGAYSPTSKSQSHRLGPLWFFPATFPRRTSPSARENSLAPILQGS